MRQITGNGVWKLIQEKEKAHNFVDKPVKDTISKNEVSLLVLFDHPSAEDGRYIILEEKLRIWEE